MTVCCVGDVMIDVLAQLPGELAIGSDTPAEVTLTGGGSAANTAAWLVAAGEAAVFVGRVGDDALGRQAMDELAAAGVDLALTVDTELPTGTCIVLVDPSGERTMVPSGGANARGGTVPALTAEDHLHLSGYAMFTEAARAPASDGMARARSAGCPISVDAASAAPLRDFGPERFLDLIAPALLFANLDEAFVLTGSPDAEAAVRVLGARCGEAIVKCGAGGAVWSDGRTVLRAECEPRAVVDTTGAGDAFAAGVLAARRRGADVEAALRAGNELAAVALGNPGGRPAVALGSASRDQPV